MINPKSLDNLQPFGTLDTDRQRELSRKGGLASVAARKDRKRQQEMFTAMLKYGDFFKTLYEISKKSPRELEKMIKDSVK